MFPEIREQLVKDSYVGINASYRHKGVKGRARGYPSHNDRSIRYLCACFADIDYYKVGLTFNAAKKHVADRCDEGILPHPSLFVDSGRGMWLLWLLNEENNVDRACYGWPEKRILYTRINQAILEKLKDLGRGPGSA